MMGLEMLLLESGFAFGLGLICAAAYRGIASLSNKTNVVAQPHATPYVAPTPTKGPHMREIPVAHPTTSSTQETPAVQNAIVPTMSAQTTEAPPPFEEPETAFTRSEFSSTPLPTDVNAVGNFVNPVENAAPAIVIARPKRASRPRKSSPDGTPRRRRAKAKQTLPAPDPIVVPVQHDEIPQPQNQGIS